MNKLPENLHAVRQCNLNKEREQSCLIGFSGETRLGEIFFEEGSTQITQNLEYRKITQRHNFRDSRPNYMWGKLSLKLIKVSEERIRKQ